MYFLNGFCSFLTRDSKYFGLSGRKCKITIAITPGIAYAIKINLHGLKIIPDQSITLKSKDKIANGINGIHRYPILPTNVTQAIVVDRFSNGVISPIYG